MFKFGPLHMTFVCPCCDVIWLGERRPEFCAECDTPGEDFEAATDLEQRQFCLVVGVQ